MRSSGSYGSGKFSSRSGRASCSAAHRTAPLQVVRSEGGEIHEESLQVLSDVGRGRDVAIDALGNVEERPGLLGTMRLGPQSCSAQVFPHKQGTGVRVLKCCNVVG